MPIEHLSPQDGPERIAEALARDGCAIVDRVLASPRRAELERELAPWIAATPTGRDDFAGRRTRRTGGLVARSPLCRELIAHPLVLGAVKAVLRQATSFHLHLTQVIAIGPGEPAQPVHRDQWAFDFFPFPKGYEVQCNTIWALTDFSEENGATRVIPGSHRWIDDRVASDSDTVALTMPAGSALMYVGSLWHGGGANTTSRSRIGVVLHYAVSWLRPVENHVLAVPRDVVRELPERLQELLGYNIYPPFIGYVDGRHPRRLLV
jgi:ectoine hydroxylase-related dioxygenase (phytanoyl-CoA dioxygenase family)